MEGRKEGRKEGAGGRAGGEAGEQAGRRVRVRTEFWDTLSARALLHCAIGWLPAHAQRVNCYFSMMRAGMFASVHNSRSLTHIHVHICKRLSAGR